MTTHFRILLSVLLVLATFSAASLYAQRPESVELPGARSGGMQNPPDSRRSRANGEADRAVAVSVVTRDGADGEPEIITLTGRHVKRFQYTIGSFKPVEIPGSNTAAGGMMGSDGAMGGSGMMGGMGVGGGTITILAIVLDERQENGRAKIELLTDVAISRGRQGSSGGSMGSSYGGSMMGGYGDPGPMGRGYGDSMGSGYGDSMGGYGLGGEPSAPMNIGPYRRLSELADQSGASSPVDVRLSPEEFQIVSQICRLKIWKADAVQAIQLAEHAPEAGVMAEQEQHLKQLLTEEFDVQLARQEIEVRTIEQRTAALKQEIERRRQAKERVIDVQLGRIVLEAQGLLGR